MAIVSGTYWCAVCDSCGEHVDGDEGSFSLAETEDRAREDVERYDGRVEKDGSITCSVCIENEADQIGEQEK